VSVENQSKECAYQNYLVTFIWIFNIRESIGVFRILIGNRQVVFFKIPAHTTSKYDERVLTFVHQPVVSGVTDMVAAEQRVAVKEGGFGSDFDLKSLIMIAFLVWRLLVQQQPNLNP